MPHSSVPALDSFQRGFLCWMVSPHRSRTLFVGLALSALALALCASGAAAARFAKPGGNAPASGPCEFANPCSLFNAASATAQGTIVKAGDEIIVEEGLYNDTDLGPQFTLPLKPGITIHGDAGEAVPSLTISTPQTQKGGLVVQAGDVLSHFHLTSLVARSALEVTGGTVEDVVVNSSAQAGTACTQTGGLIRNSACIATGFGGTAIGAQMFLEDAPGHALTAKLRNVTAIATESGMGLFFKAFQQGNVTIDGVGVLASGTEKDVVAEGFAVGANPAPGSGANVAVNLKNSDYEKVRTDNDSAGETITVSPPGVGTNITGKPLLAADQFHELPGSPTIDAGATDEESSATDIDGDPRTIRIADIGADEFVPAATTTTLSCTPEAFKLGEGPASCLATVTSANAQSPSGAVGFESTIKGGFGGGGSCNLAPAGAGEASCRVAYAPTVPGAHEITASYEGDPGDGQSQAKANITVAPHAGEPPPSQAPNTSLTKKPKARSSNRLAKFGFASDQAGSTFQCKLDRGPFKPCSSPFQARVRPGRHVLQVQATSPSGLTDPTPAVAHWTVLRPRRR